MKFKLKLRKKKNKNLQFILIWLPQFFKQKEWRQPFILQCFGVGTILFTL